MPCVVETNAFGCGGKCLFSGLFFRLFGANVCLTRESVPRYILGLHTEKHGMVRGSSKKESFHTERKRRGERKKRGA